MANCVKVTESWKQRGASSDGIPGVTPIRQTNTRVFSVKFASASPSNAQIAVIANDGTNSIPAQGSMWDETAPWLTCRGIHVLDPQGPTLFHVIAEYSGLANPFGQAPILRYSGMKHSEEMGHAADGAPYINSIGIRLTDCYRDFYDKIFTLTRNEASDAIVGGDWRGVVNSASLTLGNFTWGPYKVKIEDITATREYMPALGGAQLSTISSVTVASGSYTLHLTSSPAGIANGAMVGAADGAGNSIQGTVQSGGGTNALVLASAGLITAGTPTSMAAGTGVICYGGGIGISYFYPVTYTLAVRTHVVTINGGSQTDIGWQTLRMNNSPAYCPTSGAAPISSLRNPPFMPEVLIKQNGTLWLPTWQGGSDTVSTLYWLLFNDYLPQDFGPLGLST